MKLARQQRIIIGRRRLVSVLRKHKIASMRTLEQKISDAGPNPQRIDPHILTIARNALIREGVIIEHQAENTPWYYLAATPFATITDRFDELNALHKSLKNNDFNNRLGQSLEIAVYRALASQSNFYFLGAFYNLNEHNDNRLYRKEEPPDIISGKSLPGKTKLDFALFDKRAGLAGIEVKNVREWFYPDRPEIRDLLLKCTALDAVPVLIARRIHFSTFLVLTSLGGVIHQTYNQLYPETDYALAERAKDKTMLGYHDIRLGNIPDTRLLKFATENLPSVLPEARRRFDEFKDITASYATGKTPYKEFANTVLHRELGESVEPEDLDF